MNKTFKTLWNDVRRCFIVANEAQKSHGKPSKSAVVAVAVAAALGATAASAAYVERGFVASSSGNLADAVDSWETKEYKSDWGLKALNASTAYALGYHGQGVAVGVMDSGAYLYHHPDLNGDRFHASEADDHYGSSGQRYPQEVEGATGDYTAGESQTGNGTIDGNWIQGTNDSHGTHVTGTVGANRDGNGMHGVSWGSDIWVGNTGGSDSTNYGPFQDYQFFYNGWKSLADNLIAANGADRGGVINNSFGTNIRIVDIDGGAKDEHGNQIVSKPGADGGNTDVHFPTDTVSQTEYEYFLFKQIYGEKGTASFVDAAYDAVKGTNVVQVFTAGNRDFKHPFYRPLYPYFNPDAEKHWVNVGGLTQDGQDADGNTKYKLWATVNEAGNAKYWTVVAPGTNIDSTVVVEDKEGNVSADYDNTYSGTSMAAPHVTGAMGVLMSRYQDMSAIQVRDVLFTTANHYNKDGSVYGDTNGNGVQDEGEDMWLAADGEVDDRYGWGSPDLDKGMYGLGQLLGHFDYNQKTMKLDVWSNDISQVALDQREREEMAWKAAAEAWLALDDSKKMSMEGLSEEQKELLGEILLDTDDDIVGLDEDQEKISEEDAIAWRTEYYQKRLEAINAKIEGNLYDGSLTKRGSGTLVMVGNNTYRGGTTVEGGTLLGFNDSFGITRDEETQAESNGKVVVNGGVFGIINEYDDQFTMKGEIKDNADRVADKDNFHEHNVDVTVNEGGTYGVVAGQDVTIGSLTLNEGSQIKVIVTDKDSLLAAYNGEEVTGSVTAEGGLTDNGATVAESDLAFFDSTVTIDAKNGKIDSTITRNDATAASYAASSGQADMANALMANEGGQVFTEMLGASKGQIRNTLASLSSDFHLAAQNATIVNAALMGRTIKDQANAYGEAKRAELENGATLWAAGMGSWGEVDAGGASVNMDVDYYAGFVGAELPYGNGNKVGVFFGYGQTSFDGSDAGDMDGDDIHIGMYGENDWEKFGLTYGFAYTTQDREGKRDLTFLDRTTRSAIDYNATVFQIFGEASYKGFNTESYQVEPYIGLSWLKVSADDFTQRAGNHSVKTEIDDQNLGLANIGVRGALPFTAGSVAMKVRADVGYMQFFGDKEATAKVTVGDAGTASITGEELSGMGMVGIGLDAAIGKNATIGINYTGAFGSDITSHGVGAKLGIKF